MLLLLCLCLFAFTYLANYSVKKVWFRLSIVSGLLAGVLFGFAIKQPPYELKTVLSGIGLGLLFSFLLIRAGIHVRRAPYINTKHW